MDVALALEQPLDQVAADEAGRAGDEVGQDSPPSGTAANLSPGSDRRDPRRARAAPLRGPRRASSPSPSVERQPERRRCAARRGRRASSAAGRTRAPRPARARARGGGPAATISVTRPIASASAAATMRPVRIRSSARPIPTIRGSRCVPPSISGTPQRRSGKPSAQSSARCAGRTTGRARARRRRTSREIAAIVGLGGVRRVKPSGPPGGRGERVERLEVGAGAEGRVARAGEHHHARLVVGDEALVGLQQRHRRWARRRRCAARVGRSSGSRPRRVARSRPTGRRGARPPPPRRSARAARAFVAALRRSLRLSRRHCRTLITKMKSGKKAISANPKLTTCRSSRRPSPRRRQWPPADCASATGAMSATNRAVVSAVLQTRGAGGSPSWPRRDRRECPTARGYRPIMAAPAWSAPQAGGSRRRTAAGSSWT